MNFIRLIFIIFLLTATLGMLNYTIFDRLNYYYLSLVVGFVALVLSYADKLCLNYFKSKEITSVEDLALVNYVKSISYTKSIKRPKLYIYEGSYKSCFVVGSLFGWSILLEKSLLENLADAQKYELISGVIDIKKKNPNFLKTFGLALQVIILRLLDFFNIKSLTTAIHFFFGPVNKLIEKLTNPKLKGKLSKGLQEFYYRNIEIQKGFKTLESLIEKTPAKVEFQTYNILQNSDVSYE